MAVNPGPLWGLALPIKSVESKDRLAKSAGSEDAWEPESSGPHGVYLAGSPFRHDEEDQKTLQIERSSPNELSLIGDLDLASYDQLRVEMHGSPGPLRLDVSGIGFMDSSGLRVILQRLESGPVTLVAPSDQVVRLLDLCGVSDWKGLTVEPGLG